MRRKRFTVLFGVVAVVALAAALVASIGSAGQSKTASGYKIYLLPKNLGNPYFTAANQGAQKAAKELGDTVTFNGPTEASAAKQVPFIDTAASQGYNVIVISADDPNAVAPALKRAARFTGAPPFPAAGADSAPTRPALCVGASRLYRRHHRIANLHARV